MRPDCPACGRHLEIEELPDGDLIAHCESCSALYDMRLLMINYSFTDTLDVRGPKKAEVIRKLNTPEGEALIARWATFDGTKTGLCESFGISRPALYRWLKDEQFKGLLENLLKKTSMRIEDLE